MHLCHSERSEGISPSTRIPLGKVPRHRDLVLRVLRQGHTDRIADPFGKKGGNRDAGFDAAGVPVTGLRHTHMERKDDTPFLHHPGKFPVSFDHDDRIAGLQRNHDLVEIRLDAHLDPLHRRQGHRLRGITVTLDI